MEFSYQYEYGEKEIEVIKNLIYSQLKKETDYKKPLGFFRLAHVLLGLGYIFLAISYYASSAMEANTFLLVLYLLLGFFWIVIGLGATGVLWNYSAKKTVASLRILKEKGNVTLNEQGVFLSSSYAEIHQFWNSLTEWGKSGSFVYVICGGFILLIDQDKITEEEYRTLRRLLEDYISLEGAA